LLVRMAESLRALHFISNEHRGHAHGSVWSIMAPSGFRHDHICLEQVRGPAPGIRLRLVTRISVSLHSTPVRSLTHNGRSASLKVLVQATCRAKDAHFGQTALRCLGGVPRKDATEISRVGLSGLPDGRSRTLRTIKDYRYRSIEQTDDRPGSEANATGRPAALRWRT
jgi:hypothetical protein